MNRLPNSATGVQWYHQVQEKGNSGVPKVLWCSDWTLLDCTESAELQATKTSMAANSGKRCCTQKGNSELSSTNCLKEIWWAVLGINPQIQKHSWVFYPHPRHLPLTSHGGHLKNPREDESHILSSAELFHIWDISEGDSTQEILLERDLKGKYILVSNRALRFQNPPLKQQF